MANENKHVGDAHNLVQGPVSGGVHFHNHRARVRRRTWLVVMVCALGLVVASAVLLARSSSLMSPGLGSRGSPKQPAALSNAPTDAAGPAFGRTRECLAPASPVRDDSGLRLTNFARTHDDTVAQNNQREQKGIDRGGWVDIGGRAQGQPVAACDAEGRTVVLSIADGELWVNPDVEAHDASQRGTGVLQEEREQWHSEGAPGSSGLTGVPAAARAANGSLVIVARDDSGRLWEKHQNSAGAKDWSAWSELPGTPVRDDPAMSQDEQEQLRVFTASQDGTVREDRVTLEPNPQPELASAVPLLPDHDIRTTPSVARGRDGCLHLFAVTASGSMVWNAETTCGDGTWRGWEDWGIRDGDGPEADKPFREESPIAIPGGDGGIVVFALDENHVLWETWQENTEEWSDWKSLGPDVVDLTAAALDPPDLVVYGVDPNGNVRHRYQDKGIDFGWSEWLNTIGGKRVLSPDQ